jgi:hypothetical protein
MSKLKDTPIKQSDLYKNESIRLAGRINKTALLKELNKVYRSGIDMVLSNHLLNKRSILIAFTWEETPQGHSFWCNLHKNGN